MAIEIKEFDGFKPKKGTSTVKQPKPKKNK